ncbi:hypothetical protein CmeUKMEL1_06955 [Cryptosporidium meleagridis]|uniref:Uncharacterized protein n=1 Tax=Cryptosporidium meleagridis TaxID=93969 RepID=A0A2P4Z060_9CRYT|nr:hypothetical protein CmeUKMEL1_06955 [Cryptosporidium meleagridis]
MKELLAQSSHTIEYSGISPKTVSVSLNSLEFGLDSDNCVEEEEERVDEVDEYRGNFSNKYNQLKRIIENICLALEDHVTGWSFEKVSIRENLEKLFGELEHLKEVNEKLVEKKGKEFYDTMKSIWNEERSLCLKLYDVKRTLNFLALQLMSGKERQISNKRRNLEINHYTGLSYGEYLDYNTLRRNCDKQRTIMQDYERRINELREIYKIREGLELAQNSCNHYARNQDYDNGNSNWEAKLERKDTIEFLSEKNTHFLSENENITKFLKIKNELRNQIISNICTIIGITF